MADPPSSSHWCLVCILFGFCLAFVVILAAVVIYHLHSNNLLPPSTSTVSTATAVTEKLQFPVFVDKNIHPCENFYQFVCKKLTRQNATEILFYNEDKFQQKWTRIRHEFHDKIMSNSNKSTKKVCLFVKDRSE